MTQLQAEYSSPRHMELIAALKAGAKPMSLVSKFKLTVGTIRKIARTARKFETFNLVLTDGESSVAVASVTTSKGFEHACRHAMKKYSAFFDGLELPTWKLVAGERSVMVVDLKGGEE